MTPSPSNQSDKFEIWREPENNWDACSKSSRIEANRHGLIPKGKPKRILTDRSGPNNLDYQQHETRRNNWIVKTPGIETSPTDQNKKTHRDGPLASRISGHTANLHTKNSQTKNRWVKIPESLRNEIRRCTKKAHLLWLRICLTQIP